MSFLLQANELLQRSRQVQNKIERERMLRESLKEYQKISNQVDLSNVCAQYRQGEKQNILPSFFLFQITLFEGIAQMRAISG